MACTTQGTMARRNGLSTEGRDASFRAPWIETIDPVAEKLSIAPDSLETGSSKTDTRRSRVPNDRLISPRSHARRRSSGAGRYQALTLPATASVAPSLSQSEAKDGVLMRVR